MNLDEALRAAARRSDDPEAERLLASGADPAARDEHGFRASDYAAGAGNMPLAGRLLRRLWDCDPEPILKRGADAAPGVLDPALLAGFERDGYVLLPGLFAGKGVGAALRRLRAWITGADKPDWLREAVWFRSAIDDPVLRSFGLHWFDAELRAFALAPEVESVLRDLHAGAHWDCVQTMVYGHPTGHPPHRDRQYLETTATVWAAGEDVGTANGGIWVAPGSHRDAAREERFTPDLREGDALVFHEETLHGASGPADSAVSRLSLTLHYVRADSDFPARLGAFSRLSFDGRYPYSDARRREAFGR